MVVLTAQWKLSTYAVDLSFKTSARVRIVKVRPVSLSRYVPDHCCSMFLGVVPFFGLDAWATGQSVLVRGLNYKVNPTFVAPVIKISQNYKGKLSRGR